MAFPKLSVIVAEILIVSPSANPLISSTSVFAVPEASIVIVTSEFKSEFVIVCAAPRLAKLVEEVFPNTCMVPPSNEASLSTGTTTCICVLDAFQYPVTTLSVTVVTAPTVKSAGTIPSTAIATREFTKF